MSVRRLVWAVARHFLRPLLITTLVFGWALNQGLAQPSSHRHFPFTAEEDADGARYVWFICTQAGAGYDYLPARQFPTCPKFRRLGEHEVPLGGDVAWWKDFMALYNPEAPVNARLMTARGNFSLLDLGKKYGRVKWFRMVVGEK